MYRILVPIDLTEDSNKVSQYALNMAASFQQAQILLLHCFQDYLADAGDDIPPFDMTISEEITENIIYRNVTEAQDTLEELYQQLLAKATLQENPPRIERAFIHGLPEDVILDEAKRFKPNLVIMGTKGEKSFPRSLFGTVTTKMVEELKIPLLTIPENYKGGSPTKIAYAANFDDQDTAAIAQLGQLLQPLASIFYYVHISNGNAVANDRQTMLEIQHTLKQKLPDLQLHYTILEHTDVSEALKAFAQENQINLLALTTHKRSLFGQLLHPSLSQKLVLQFDIPLLIMHSTAE